jgi:two-component system, LuxR family, response regulator FixJ
MSTLFVVDEDVATARRATSILKAAQYEVLAFTSPADALVELEDRDSPMPDALLLDPRMPEMDCREFFRRARLAGLTSPVVILSTHGAAAASNELGAAAALEKPFDADSLLHTVEGVLQME